MRQITLDSCNAFHFHRNFKRSNTQVKSDINKTELFLFGNKIAEYDRRKNSFSITNAGYQTVTTKERLNGLRGVHVQQKKGIWYLNGKEWNGEWVKIF